MSPNLQLLENDYWQVGILSETGASIAFGRIKHGDQWVDFMRPTSEGDYGNASLCASFLLIPYSNRIKAGRFSFGGADYQLAPNTPEGNAQHGVVRKVPWQVTSADQTHIRLSYHSGDFSDVNFPFAFSAEATYRLDGANFIMEIRITSDDTRPFPAGFGHHPYFVRTITEHPVQVEIPCDQQYELVEKMAVSAAVPIKPQIDFRHLRPIEPENTGRDIDDVLTGRQNDSPIRFVYGNVELAMTCDPIFQQIVFFAPSGKPFYAVEPVTNTNDGFNLYDKGIPGTGVFVLQPGESQNGNITLRVIQS